MFTAHHRQLASRRLYRTICLAFVFCAAAGNVSSAQTFTTLVSFNGPNGSTPSASLIQGVDGSLYGTTYSGGSFGINCAAGCGTVFKITPAGTLTTVHLFDYTNGAYPFAALAQGSDGNFYGTTTAGGANGHGTVFQLTPAGVFTPLYSFCSQPNCADGATPYAGLVQATDGNFYGTTSEGGMGGGACGSGGCGTVFRITTAGALTTLHLFCSQPNCTDGVGPFAGLIQATDGSLYGTAHGGGSGGSGTVFKITTTGTLTNLYSFCSQLTCDDGAGPSGALVQGNDGNFYGTTQAGGFNINGTVFRITPAGALTTLHIFCTSGGFCADGSMPIAGMVQATDGNFYGTTGGGGTDYPGGTIFKITPAGTLTVLHYFQGAEGINPNSRLVQATDGNFYGTAPNGGGNSNGTVYSLAVGLNPFVETQPASGTIGSPVTILGTNLTGATSVTFNGTSALILSNTGSAITTTVPVGATTGTVKVTLASGRLNSNPDFQVTGALQFVPVPPCRVVDTRQTGGPIQGGTLRSFIVSQLGGCGVPSSGVAAYSLNLAIVPQNHHPLGYLTIWPEREIQPFVSTMNSQDGRIKSNAAIVPSGNNAVSVFVTDTTDVILDIDGYFQAPGEQTYQFYPLAPCRVIDTRGPIGDLGGPYLHGGRNDGSHRDFPVRGSDCIPADANVAAYSLNFTVVPHVSGQRLGYLTVWPEGSDQPFVSTLNNPTATVVANAAIVPAGMDGGISVFAFDDTDMIADINGYFGPAGQGGYSFYPAAPCRAYDSRNNNGQPFRGTKVVDIAGSPCAPAANARGYVFSATVVPDNHQPMGYLTLWPDGENMPLASTLNAYDGLVTSNMAIVPNGNGSISAYADGLTHLILDISGYFAP